MGVSLREQTAPGGACSHSCSDTHTASWLNSAFSFTPQLFAAAASPQLNLVEVQALLL